MTIQKAIEGAIEGGWKPLLAHEVWYANWNNRSKPRTGVRASYVIHEILLDPLFWQALGKVKGWVAPPEVTHNTWQETGKLKCWICNMHRHIDALIDGKTSEEFFSSL